MTNTPDKITRTQWLIIITIMMTAVLEVLDSTIVNVALPNMMASLGANQNQITWVLTSYVVASAIMLPLTGFLSNRMGRKKLIIMDVTGFMIASALSGASQSLDMMVFFRLFQGAFGAALIPLSQAILRDSFSTAEQGKAMSIWGLGIMAAPILGPTLGGFITEYLNWRWIFYINIPICAIAIMMTIAVIPDTKKIMQKIDFVGLGLMVVGVGCLQYMLDQGNEHSWFSSNLILAMGVLAVAGIVLFVIRTLTNPPGLIKLSIFKDRNFTLSTIVLTIFAGCLFSTIAVQPVMLEKLFHYPTLTTGLVMAPMGLASGVAMGFSANFMNKINVKILLTASILCCAGASYMFSSFNLDTNMPHFAWTNALQGFGLGLMMVPISTYSLLTLSPADNTEGAGLFSYGRMIGTSVGISLISTLLSSQLQVNWHHLAGKLTAFSPNLSYWLAGQHARLSDPHTHATLTNIIYQQAYMQSFINAYHAVSIAFLLMLPFIWGLKHVDMRNAKVGGH